MAQKKKTAADEATKVTRIKATDTTAKPVKQTSAKTDTVKKASTAPTKVAKADKPATDKEGSKNPLKALGGYFKGAWVELRQVRWPNRRTTWGLTLAVLVFTGFFLGLIILLDYGFQALFEWILQ